MTKYNQWGYKTKFQNKILYPPSRTTVHKLNGYMPEELGYAQEAWFYARGMWICTRSLVMYQRNRDMPEKYDHLLEEPGN